MKQLDVFLCIVRRRDTEKFAEFFGKMGVDILLSANCQGTAQYKALDLLGVEQVDKTLFLSVLRQEKLRSVIRHLSTDMQIDYPGAGVGLAVPLDSVGGQTALDILTAGAPLREREVCVTDTKYELIVAIASRGSTDAVMDAAREAGAGGGTVIRSKGTQTRKTGGFFKITVADEKEIILIVTPSGKRDAIMQNILDKAGAGTPSHAVMFSLPVTETAGFRLLEEAAEEEATAE